MIFSGITPTPLQATCTPSGSAAASAVRYGVAPCWWYSVGTTVSGARPGSRLISRSCSLPASSACARAAAAGPVPYTRLSPPQCHSSYETSRNCSWKALKPSLRSPSSFATSASTSRPEL